MSTLHSKFDLQQKCKDWDAVKDSILRELYHTMVDVSLDNCWVPVKEIFAHEFGTIPANVSPNAFSTIWRNKKNIRDVGNGSHIFIHTLNATEWGIIIRYQIGSWWQLRVQPGIVGGASGNADIQNQWVVDHGFPDWQHITNLATRDSCNIIDINKLQHVRDHMKDIWKDDPHLEVPSPARNSSSCAFVDSRKNDQRKTRSEMTLDSLISSRDRFSTFNNLHHSVQSSVISKLVDFYNNHQPNSAFNNKEITATNLLDFFWKGGKSFSCEKFVDCFISSSKVASGTYPRGRKLFPMSSSLDELGKTNKSRIISVMRDIAKHSAECLVENENDACRLLTMMFDSKNFAMLLLPEVRGNEKEEFMKNPVVKRIKQALIVMKSNDVKFKNKQEEKEQLLSLISETYPQSWIQDYFGVGRKTTKAAHDRATKFGGGVPLPEYARKSITRPGRRSGQRESFTRDWFHAKENTECSPCIQRDSFTGKLVNKTRYFRLRNRNCGYHKYCNDAELNGITPYSKPHFYKLNDELGIVDRKSDASLCPSCHKLGTENYVKLQKAITFIYTNDHNPKFVKAMEITKDIEEYFMRGGKFYHSLDQTSECIDWCLHFQLSDPFDEFLQCKCSMDHPNEDYRHEHKMRDSMVLKKENFFDQLIVDAYEKKASRTIELSLKHDDIVDITKEKYDSTTNKATVIWMRHGVIRVRLSNGAMKDFRWEFLRDWITREDFDHLTIIDYLYRVFDNHKNYLRHLYLDRNQSYGELMVTQHYKSVAIMDYCMKLCAKSWASDTSKFHVYMNKGTSVHVFCLKNRVTEVTQEMGLEEGDYQIVWIDSFCSNTTQGAYDTLCVIESDLKTATKLFPKIQSVALVSDAGSGYKTAQSILGIRGMKNITRM